MATRLASFLSISTPGAQLQTGKALEVICKSKFNFIYTSSPLKIVNVKHRFDDGLILPGTFKM